MHIKLDDKFRVEAEDRCWSLTEKTSQAKDREGKLKTDAEGRSIHNEDTTYHANLRQALTMYLDKCLKPSREVSGVLKRLSEAEQRIAEMKI